jgi:hypothetical protein
VGGIGDAATEAVSSAITVVRLSMMGDILVVVVAGKLGRASMKKCTCMSLYIMHSSLIA